MAKKLTEESDERIKVIEEDKASAVRKYDELQSQMEAQRGQLETLQTEVFEINQKSAEAYDAKVLETDMLLNDVESWQQKASIAEREVDRLKEKIQAIQQSPTGDDQTISQWSNVPEQNTEGTASN